MKPLPLFKKFIRDTDGAVTVDWVVITAAVVGMTLLVMNILEPSMNDSAGVITDGIFVAVADGLT